MNLQTTIANSVTCTGMGVHSGQTIRVELHPSVEDSGLVFHIMQEHKCLLEIPAMINFAVKKQLRTRLARNDMHIDTVEHLLAAIRGMQIDNLIIKVWGNEIPILDGSALSWCQLLLTANSIKQSKNRQYFKVLQPIKVTHNDAWCMFEPCAEYQVCYTFSHQHPLIQAQHVCETISEESFMHKIAGARTFGFLKDYERLKKIGLGNGATLANTIVFTDDNIISHVGLKWQDEPARHKLLDVIGDMALLGYPILGKFTGYQSGHALNQQLASTLLADTNNYQIISH